MDSRYYNFYDDLYQRRGYTFSPNEFQLNSIIDDKIRSLNLTERIRPDAKVFLATNFDVLIVTPLMHFGEVDSNILQQNLSEDIKSILVSSAQVSNLRNRRNGTILDPINQYEISSHDVLIAIQSIWSLLLTLRIEVWGD